MNPAYHMADCGRGMGGAIYNGSTATALLINCTLTANSADGAGGPSAVFSGSPAAEGQGGGIANVGNLQLVHSTLANNKAVGGDSQTVLVGGGARLRLAWAADCIALRVRPLRHAIRSSRETAQSAGRAAKELLGVKRQVPT